MSSKKKSSLPKVVAEWSKGENRYRIVAVESVTAHSEKATPIVEYADRDAMGELVWRQCNGFTHAPFNLLKRLLVDGHLRIERATK